LFIAESISSDILLIKSKKMKILILGFLTFFGWSALSTHIWVCNVKGLCNDSAASQVDRSGHENSNRGDSIKISPVDAKTVTPEDITIYFEFDKYEFRADSLTERYFAKAKNFLDKNSPAVLTITGYTDFIGTENYNQALGLRRAQSVQNYFNGNGMKRNKMVIASNGENNPAGDNKTAKGRADNRRTVITIKN
jgi:outer membrane protein OmpA-like peptidoglycan-associated protein